MREFKRRRGHTEELAWLVLRGCGVLVLLVVTATLIHATWDIYTKMAAASQAQQEAAAELAQLQAQQQGVGSTLATLSSERGEEAQIRDRFGVARPGEGEIDIVRSVSSSSANDASHESWWQRVSALFMW